MPRPRTPLAMAALVLAVVAGAAGPSGAAPDPAGPPPAVAMPRGSRADGDRVRSALGFRATVDYFARRWKQAGIAVRRIGPYQIAGVEVVRFVATAPAPPWRAVHVYRVAGVTWIFVVAAPLDGARPTE